MWSCAVGQGMEIIRSINRGLTVISRMLVRTPRMFSSAQTPSFVAYWKAATQDSLISFKYCTPLVTSTIRLGPVVLGPKHQIFLASRPNSSAMTLARNLKSSRALTLPLSIVWVSSSSIGSALRYRQLCLFWDLERATIDDSAFRGSDFLRGTPAWSSSRS